MNTDEALDFIGFGRFQVKMMFLCGLAWMCDAMETMLLSFLSSSVACDFDISKAQVSDMKDCVFENFTHCFFFVFFKRNRLL